MRLFLLIGILLGWYGTVLVHSPAHMVLWLLTVGCVAVFLEEFEVRGI